MVWKWLEPSATHELDGSAGFPQHLAERFGSLRGLFAGQDESAVVTAPEAAVLGQDASVFISMDGGRALLFAEVGPPTLCVD